MDYRSKITSRWHRSYITNSKRYSIQRNLVCLSYSWFKFDLNLIRIILYKTQLSILAEGTRFSDDKHAASMEVATSKGLPHLKHHLLPRTKGFTLLCNAVNNRIEWLYDITLAIPKVNGTQKPSLKLIKDGVPIDFQIYIRRIPLSSVPLDEKTSAEWLQKLYQEKVGIF